MLIVLGFLTTDVRAASLVRSKPCSGQVGADGKVVISHCIGYSTQKQSASLTHNANDFERVEVDADANVRVSANDWHNANQNERPHKLDTIPTEPTLKQSRSFTRDARELQRAEADVEAYVRISADDGHKANPGESFQKIAMTPIGTTPKQSPSLTRNAKKLERVEIDAKPNVRISAEDGHNANQNKRLQKIGMSPIEPCNRVHRSEATNFHFKPPMAYGSSRTVHTVDPHGRPEEANGRLRQKNYAPSGSSIVPDGRLINSIQKKVHPSTTGLYAKLVRQRSGQERQFPPSGSAPSSLGATATTSAPIQSSTTTAADLGRSAQASVQTREKTSSYDWSIVFMSAIFFLTNFLVIWIFRGDVQKFFYPQSRSADRSSAQPSDAQPLNPEPSKSSMPRELPDTCPTSFSVSRLGSTISLDDSLSEDGETPQSPQTHILPPTPEYVSSHEYRSTLKKGQPPMRTPLEGVDSESSGSNA